MIAIHAALDSRGRVVTYGTNPDGQQTGRFIYDIWTPEASAAAGHNTLANTTQTDLFCSLQVNRPDTGDMLIFGGDNWDADNNITTNFGNADINELDVETGQLNPIAGMNRPRWYGTSTVMPDGSIFVMGGGGGEDHPELWTAENGAQLLEHLDTSAINWWYPRNFLLPDGRIFGVDVEGHMYFIAADLSDITMAGQLGQDRWGYGTTAVMFEPGRILHFGGETTSAVIIDVNGPVPVVTPAAPTTQAREWVNSTLLPDGRVIATGGASYYRLGQIDGRPLADYNITNEIEIWDPATGQWSVESSGIKARLYHSTALLLPDGRVLVAGGGAPGPVFQTNAEIFSPDYLFSAQGGPVARPEITAVSDNDLALGQTFNINVGGGIDIGRVTVLKAGTVTHSVNMEQRISDLTFTENGGTLTATLPASGTELTPGYYLLTVLTTAGVPSESVMVRVQAQAPALDGVQAQINRLYLAYMGRNADAGGLQYWTTQINSGAVTLAQASDFFAASAEFLGIYGQLTDEQFVDQVYRNVVGREADAEGRAFWLGQLAAGQTRGQIMLGFSESPEFIALTNNGGVPAPVPAPAPAPAPAPEPQPNPEPQTPVAEPYADEVTRLYRAYFLRAPDQGGLAYWTNQRAAGLPLAAVSDAFAASEEFALQYGQTSNGQFVELVYNNVLGRPSDPGGLAYWTAQLAAGQTRGQVMVGFLRVSGVRGPGRRPRLTGPTAKVNGEERTSPGPSARAGLFFRQFPTSGPGLGQDQNGGNGQTHNTPPHQLVPRSEQHGQQRPRLGVDVPEYDLGVSPRGRVGCHLGEPERPLRMEGDRRFQPVRATDQHGGGGPQRGRRSRRQRRPAAPDGRRRSRFRPTCSRTDDSVDAVPARAANRISSMPRWPASLARFRRPDRTTGPTAKPMTIASTSWYHIRQPATVTSRVRAAADHNPGPAASVMVVGQDRPGRHSGTIASRTAPAMTTGNSVLL